jgi:SAM-dependent methyltransferase
VRFNTTPRLEDFEDPELTALAVDQLGIPLVDWRRGHRKWWEWAQVLRAAEAVGALRDDARVLGIASGHETPLYALANRVRLVVATDMYGATVFAPGEASDAMMRDPACFAPFEYRREALLVVRSDARDLPFAAESFDFAFSCSSIEHFGRDADVRRSVLEAFRVLKPGGAYACAVDFLFDADVKGRKPRRRRRGLLGDRLTREDVQRIVLDGTGFEVDEEIDFEAEPDAPLVDLDTNRRPNEQFPHLWLSTRGQRFTSLFVLLHKPTDSGLPPLSPRPDPLGL